MARVIQKQKYTSKREPTPFHCYDAWNRQLECYKTLFAFVQLNPLFLSQVKQTKKQTNKKKTTVSNEKRRKRIRHKYSAC